MRHLDFFHKIKISQIREIQNRGSTVLMNLNIIEREKRTRLYFFREKFREFTLLVLTFFRQLLILILSV